MLASQHTAPQILVADDDQEVLRVAKRVLEQEGFVAVTARDGKEAYQLLQTDEPFAAAILDLVMPHIEGRDLVRYMQSEKRLMNVPVIIMTTELNTPLTSDSFFAGAAAFLPKPFSDAQLTTMLNMFVTARASGKTA